MPKQYRPCFLFFESAATGEIDLTEYLSPDAKALIKGMNPEDYQEILDLFVDLLKDPKKVRQILNLRKREVLPSFIY